LSIASNNAGVGMICFAGAGAVAAAAAVAELAAEDVGGLDKDLLRSSEAYGYLSIDLK
jgi:hypothetical protein